MSIIFDQHIFKIFSHTRPFHNHVFNSRSLAMFKWDRGGKDLSPYIITRASKEEFDQILKVMHESFYNEEPTISALKVHPSPILDEMALRAMTEGFTLVAKCKYNGCIVGACINESTHPWDPDMEEKLACTIQDENLKKLILFNAYLKRAPDLYRCLGVQSVFEMTYLFVKRAHRKKGLAFRLIQDSRNLGADAGFSVVRCDATSPHTSAICKKLNMQKVAEVPYCSYLDYKLEPVFQPPWPNESVKIYCDCAPQYNVLYAKLQEKSRLLGLFKPKPKKGEPLEPHM